ncbi:MAG: hypothetical protein OCU16_02340 [Candidatus Methanospirare jalkutatii]|nr:hypothetical protein [Candidatus Methanospirare jalkutatii]
MKIEEKTVYNNLSSQHLKREKSKALWAKGKAITLRGIGPPSDRCAYERKRSVFSARIKRDLRGSESHMPLLGEVRC